MPRVIGLLALACTPPLPAVTSEPAAPPSVPTPPDPPPAPDPVQTDEPVSPPALIPLPPGNSACGSTAGTWFDDVTSCAGLSDGLHVRDPTEVEWYVTGQGWLDVDRDGWLDLFVTSPASENHLFLGQPDGTFVERTDPALRSRDAGAVGVADTDGDGWDDLFVTGRQEDWLFLNDAGAFLGPVAGGPSGRGLGQGAAFADLQGDGLLDLFVTNYFCPDCVPSATTDAEAAQDRFLVQSAAGWTDATASVFGLGVSTQGFGFAAAWADFDGDGDADLYVVNDKGIPGPEPAPGDLLNRNTYWRNDSPCPAGPCFTEVAQTNGTDLRIDSMGVAVGDYDNDLDLDIAVSDGGSPHLLRNEGNGQFVEVTADVGLDAHDGTGWGLTWLDVDNDGDLDLFNAQTAADQLWLNDGGLFVEQAAAAGLNDGRLTYGVAAADYDRDGRVDLVIGDPGWAYRLHRNVHSATHHWLGLRLEGAGAGGTGAIGAQVFATDDTGRVQMRHVHSGSSLGSGEDRGVHFGFGTATPVALEVVWPDGARSAVPVGVDTWGIHRR